MVAEKARRQTRQRAVILEELRNVTSHPTAAELYDMARTRLPKISLGTVYTNLELLARTGVIRKLEISGSAARFDGNTKRHCHVHCVRCGRVDDVHDVPVDFTKMGDVSLGGYEILASYLGFIGVCPECATHELGDDVSQREPAAHEGHFSRLRERGTRPQSQARGYQEGQADVAGGATGDRFENRRSPERRRTVRRPRSDGPPSGTSRLSSWQ